jgi:hypothetical protein
LCRFFITTISYSHTLPYFQLTNRERQTTHQHPSSKFQHFIHHHSHPSSLPPSLPPPFFFLPFSFSPSSLPCLSSRRA